MVRFVVSWPEEVAVFLAKRKIFAEWPLLRKSSGFHYLPEERALDWEEGQYVSEKPLLDAIAEYYCGG